MDDEEEGYVPDYAETVKRLQAAARNELLPLPGVSKEDLEDPQRLVVEGIIDRTEANEAAQKKRKVYILLKHSLGVCFPFSCLSLDMISVFPLSLANEEIKYNC